jgi:hypothetical protein
VIAIRAAEFLLHVCQAAGHPARLPFLGFSIAGVRRNSYLFSARLSFASDCSSENAFNLNCWRQFFDWRSCG